MKIPVATYKESFTVTGADIITQGMGNEEIFYTVPAGCRVKAARVYMNSALSPDIGTLQLDLGQNPGGSAPAIAPSIASFDLTDNEKKSAYAKDSDHSPDVADLAGTTMFWVVTSNDSPTSISGEFHIELTIEQTL
jgi:hypothetical protein